jgi:hypothetical protein
MYEYKFLKVRTNQSEEEVNSILNGLGKQGWRLINFFPTSDNELGKVGVMYKNEAWDVGYAFVFVKETN